MNLNNLVKTYDYIANAEDDLSDDLLEISHSTQQAHVEIILNNKGEFKRGEIIERENARKIIPVTEDSASRSSGSAPHPLFDKLKYIAGDYKFYCGENNEEYYKDYMENLKDWTDSEYGDPKLKSVFLYLQKKSVIKDLIDDGIFSVNHEGKLTKKWELLGKDKKISVGDQSEAFIVFSVEGFDYTPNLYEDKKIRKKFIQYYSSKNIEKGFCRVLGEEKRISNKHPSKIRNDGDKSKLISSNDDKNFTYRGRFDDAKQAYQISYEASQKAHNALKWLIQRQNGRNCIDSKVFIFWGTKLEKVPYILGNSREVANGWKNEIEEKINLEADIAVQFQRAIKGYKGEIIQDTQLTILGLDAATTGRLAVIYLKEYNGKQECDKLIDNIEAWHKTCRWNIPYYNEKEKEGGYYYGAPAPIDIAKVAYGVDRNGKLDVNKKLLSNTVERILPCICDGKYIPRDIVQAAINKSKFPQNYSNLKIWIKVLTIACALYCKEKNDYRKEKNLMEVKDTNDIGYNCGRLLAIADAIETWALLSDKGEEKDIRATNAIRMYTRFTQKPCDTWLELNRKLIPYREKLGVKGKSLYELLGEVSSKIDIEEFRKAGNFGGEFCLGFDTQRQVIIKNSIEKKKN